MVHEILIASPPFLISKAKIKILTISTEMTITIPTFALDPETHVNKSMVAITQR